MPRNATLTHRAQHPLPNHDQHHHRITPRNDSYNDHRSRARSRSRERPSESDSDDDSDTEHEREARVGQNVSVSESDGDDGADNSQDSDGSDDANAQETCERGEEARYETKTKRKGKGTHHKGVLARTTQKRERRLMSGSQAAEMAATIVTMNQRFEKIETSLRTMATNTSIIAASLKGVPSHTNWDNSNEGGTRKEAVAEPKPTRKSPKPADPTGPKRPANAYQLYMAHMRNRDNAYVGMHQKHVAIDIAKRWNAVKANDPATHKIFQRQADKQKALYEQAKHKFALGEDFAPWKSIKQGRDDASAKKAKGMARTTAMARAAAEKAPTAGAVDKGDSDDGDSESDTGASHLHSTSREQDDYEVD